MGKRMNIVNCKVEVVGAADWVFGSVETAVICVADFWQWFAKSPIEVLEGGSSIIKR